MSETLSEAAGCALLARIFRARGYAIRRNVPFREYGVSFDIDGWDAKARVGFEFLSSEQEDHDDLTLREFERLKDAEQRGELAIFIIDEVETLSATGLSEAAEAFLDDVARIRRPRRTASKAKSTPVKAKAAPVKAKAAPVKQKARPTKRATKKSERATKTRTTTAGTVKKSAGGRVRRPSRRNLLRRDATVRVKPGR